MKRAAVLLLLLAICFQAEPAQAKGKKKRLNLAVILFDTSKGDYFRIYYRRGGVNRRQIVQNGAAYACTGGYFDPDVPIPKRDAIDYVKIGGKEKHPPAIRVIKRGHRIVKKVLLNRPIFAINRRNQVRIVMPAWRQKVRKDELNALAGEYFPQDPNRPRWRQFIGKRGSVVGVFSMVGTAQDCLRVLRRYGMEKHRIFMDGGSSCYTYGPTAIGCFRRSSSQLAARG